MIDRTQREIERVTHQLTIQQSQQTRTQRNITTMYASDHTKKEIIDKLNTSYPTIAKTLELPRTLRTLSLLQELKELKGGPSNVDRRNMAWRIAQANEDISPSISLKAVDILNKQAGEYAPTDTQSTGLTVNIQNFVMPQAATPITPIEKDITPKDFAPITIEVP